MKNYDVVKDLDSLKKAMERTKKAQTISESLSRAYENGANTPIARENDQWRRRGQHGVYQRFFT